MKSVTTSRLDWYPMEGVETPTSGIFMDGWRLLRLGRWADAVLMFREHTLQFPDDWRGHACAGYCSSKLAHEYTSAAGRNGHNRQALKSYNKALELMWGVSDNMRARFMIFRGAIKRRLSMHPDEALADLRSAGKVELEEKEHQDLIYNFACAYAPTEPNLALQFIRQLDAEYIALVRAHRHDYFSSLTDNAYFLELTEYPRVVKDPDPDE